MKKWILVLSLCLLLTGCVQAYDGPVEQKRVRLTEEIVYHDRSTWESSFDTRYEHSFDVSGNRVQTLHSRNGKATQVYRLRYDESGNMTYCASYDYVLGLPILWSITTEYTYDALGRNLTTTHKSFQFWNNVTIHRSYGENSETIIRTDWQGNVLRTTRTELDEAGRPIRQVDPDFEYRWYYDEAGNEIRMEQWENGSLLYYQDSTYDDQNRLLTESWSHNGEVKSHRYTYDDQNHTVTRHSPNGLYEVEYYNELGEMYYAATYRDSGELYAEEYITYGTIDVAGKEDVS